MKTISHARKGLWTLVSTLLVLALTAAAFVVVPAAPAYADEEDPPSAERSRDRGTLLERAFDREKDWLDRQSANLERAAGAADKLEDLIGKARDHGVDVKDLEAALGRFQRQLDAAEAYHAEAERIIAAHAGFNGGGKVIDQEQALETVRDAGAALRQTMETLRGAAHDLRDAVRDWREAHPRPTEVPEATDA